MNILVLQPHSHHLAFTWYGSFKEKHPLGGIVRDYRSRWTTAESLQQALGALPAGASRPDLIAVRGTYGGEAFSGPALVTPETLKRLETLAPAAPLHVPVLIEMLRACQALWVDCPLVVVFETAFFVSLPPREYRYAMNADLFPDLRRYGYHGLYHEAACAAADRGRRVRGGRVLSICLEPRPELAAVMGMQPVMVSGGATPLEGLPGETSCGEMDAGVITRLAAEWRWGPEQINRMLTRQSGLRGLTGRPIKLDQALRAKDQAARKACALFAHRLLLSAGSGVAAMGGVEEIVFSGRYAHAGRQLGPRLARALAPRQPSGRLVPWSMFRFPLEELIAARAMRAVFPSPSPQVS